LTKSQLRDEYFQKRALISIEDRNRIHHQVFSSVLEIIKRKSFQIVHCYIGNPERGEFPTLELIAQIEALGISVCAPRMSKGRKLNSYLIQSDTRLELHPFGVMEPAPVNFVDPAKIDLVIVPLLIHDQNHHRIGYGGGYYDRYLPSCSNAFKLGYELF
jgi:5-formyltetrahydrofolate cyclo-ligase